ncbi:MAG: hypothetical protein HOY69_41360 [Streptomyces sp.]|nr:hypothetical protein [Streptomyces sp.]
MASRVLSLRIDADLWDRIRDRAARRGMTAQDYVVMTLVRDDFDERFKAAVEETERLYGDQDPPEPAGAAEPAAPPAPAAAPYSSPSAGIR